MQSPVCTILRDIDRERRRRGKSTGVLETPKLEVSGIDREERGARGGERGWDEGTESSNVQRLYTEASGRLVRSSHFCLGVKSKITIARSVCPGCSCFSSLSAEREKERVRSFDLSSSSSVLQLQRRIRDRTMFMHEELGHTVHCIYTYLLFFFEQKL